MENRFIFPILDYFNAKEQKISKPNDSYKLVPYRKVSQGSLLLNSKKCFLLKIFEIIIWKFVLYTQCNSA